MNIEKVEKSVENVISKEIDVEVMSFNELTNLDYPLMIDNYQRPYVWTVDKLNQLLNDLIDFRPENESLDIPYYMGSILLHKSDNSNDKSQSFSSPAYFVIDGQQRLSTLSILYYVLNSELPQNFEFNYRSLQSVANLKIIHKEIISRISDEETKEILKSIFNNMQFTVITVTNEDLAFTFFDSQNSRGVPLGATDLLKAYHLRAIKDEQQPQQQDFLQRNCARRWEIIQKTGKNSKKDKWDFSKILFERYLWRARHWRGSHNITYENHDAILESFSAKTIKYEKIDSFPIFANPSNQLAHSLKVEGENNYTLMSQPIKFSSEAIYLPFNIRQPIFNGINFFMFADKYARLSDLLFNYSKIESKQDSEELRQFRIFYNSVVKQNSFYLRNLFELAVLTYYDKYQEKQLLEFSQKFEMILGMIRLYKSSIYDVAPIKYLRESDVNILDVITASYMEDEIFAVLDNDKNLDLNLEPNGIYDKDKNDFEDRVRGRYLKSMFNYYSKDGSIDKIINNSTGLKNFISTHKISLK